MDIPHFVGNQDLSERGFQPDLDPYTCADGERSLPRFQWELRITSLLRLVHRSSRDHSQTECLGAWEVRPRIPAPELVHEREKRISGVFCVAQGHRRRRAFLLTLAQRGSAAACSLLSLPDQRGQVVGTGSGWSCLDSPEVITENREVYGQKIRHLSWGGGPVGNPSVLATCLLVLP